MMYGYYGPDYAIGHLLDFAFWIVIIAFVFAFLRRSRGWRRSLWDHDHAMDVLKERYAKGEINKEEFEAKKKDLMS